jgi:hypothetical protein
VVELCYSYRGESDFKGINEGISGRYNPGTRVYLNPDNAPRVGPYLLVTFNCGVRRLPIGGSLRIDYYTNLSPEIQTHECLFSGPIRGVVAELYVRLKHCAWGSKKIYILGWHAELRDNEGTLISSAQSFAWAMPNEIPARFSANQRKTGNRRGAIPPTDPPVVPNENHLLPKNQ